MPGGDTAACAPDPANPPPCPLSRVVVQAVATTSAHAARTNPPNPFMRSSAALRSTTLPAMVTPVMSDELLGRVAVVTGGASGIGAASAALLANAGASVIVADLQEGQNGPG